MKIIIYSIVIFKLLLSQSLFADEILVKGKNLNAAKNIISDFLNMIKNGSEIKSNDLNEDQKIKIMSLSGVKKYPMRVKCATLSWHTLVSAMNSDKKSVNTEAID